MSNSVFRKSGDFYNSNEKKEYFSRVSKATPSLSTTTPENPEDFWSSTGEYLLPTETILVDTFISTSTTDESSGDGAQEIYVSGMDVNGQYIEEWTSTNGTTAVTLKNSYFRVNEFYVSNTGSNFKNSGDLKLYNAVHGSGTLYGYILRSENSQHSSVYSPLKTLWIDRITITPRESSSVVTAVLKVGSNDIWQIKNIFVLEKPDKGNCPIGYTCVHPFKVEKGQDIKLTVTSVTNDLDEVWALMEGHINLK